MHCIARYPGASGLTASHEPTNAALQPGSAESGVAEIFKKTPCAAGLKPRGRYVAKDMREIGNYGRRRRGT